MKILFLYKLATEMFSPIFVWEIENILYFCEKLSQIQSKEAAGMLVVKAKDFIYKNKQNENKK